MAKVSAAATQRLRSDYKRIKRDPVPYITAEPLPSNIFEWHYVVQGPEDSPYTNGFYHGRLMFPTEYPFRPPSIYMDTPSGRFEINTRLCLSISDFHPDSWNPAWSVASILTGLLSFMLETAPTVGSVESSESEKKVLALRSGKYNLTNKVFCQLFPDTVKIIKSNEQRRAEELKAKAPAAAGTSNSSAAETSNSSAAETINSSAAVTCNSSAAETGNSSAAESTSDDGGSSKVAMIATSSQAAQLPEKASGAAQMEGREVTGSHEDDLVEAAQV